MAIIWMCRALRSRRVSPSLPPLARPALRASTSWAISGDVGRPTHSYSHSAIFLLALFAAAVIARQRRLVAELLLVSRRECLGHERREQVESRQRKGSQADNRRRKRSTNPSDVLQRAKNAKRTNAARAGNEPRATKFRKPQKTSPMQQ